jgi:hypothetical protein
MNVALASKAQVSSQVRLEADTNTGARVETSRGTHRDAMLFYARLPQDVAPTNYREGVWAFGVNRRGNPALSLLLNTETLGNVSEHYPFGYHHYFTHAGDGSVSRLARPDGEYNVPAVYESLLFGSENAYQNQLDGITVCTERLLSGASVTVKYRTDTRSGWKRMGTSSQKGKTEHTFTKQEGAPIGNFPEIQFRVESIGKQALKSIVVSITELDDKPHMING